ncbi:MAG: hypothetical protein KAT58_08095 [candidate division Zixibacteria bacterium]|nr:hypothetical protein [candidate division Zixibacteria bacterium]
MKRIDLAKIKTRRMSRRRSKVDKKQFAARLSVGGLSDFIDSLPDLLKARDLKSLISRIEKARTRKKPIIWMFGAHILKAGLVPLLCEIIKQGMAQQISTNNAVLIHDLELAFFGRTSEDVDRALVAGEFGMTADTAELYSQVVELAAKSDIGLGEAAGRFIAAQARHKSGSVFAAAHRQRIAATVHVAIGTDVVNCHQSFDGAAVGRASQIDFEIFCYNVARLKNGGVALNFGSAVIMPEVFLKAIAVARNLDSRFGKFTTANFDMITHYRPRQNIIRRPQLLGAQTYDFTGHHEIMLPLLWAGIKDRLNLTT